MKVMSSGKDAMESLFSALEGEKALEENLEDKIKRLEQSVEKLEGAMMALAHVDKGPPKNPIQWSRGFLRKRVLFKD